MSERKSIMLYLDAVEQWDMLSDEQAGKLIKALLIYGKTGEKLETKDGMLAMAFSFMTAQIDRDGEKWAKKCERNAEYYQKRKKNYSDNSDKFSIIQTIQHNSDSDTDTVTDKDTDTDTVTDTVTDKDTDILKEKKKKTSELDLIINNYTDNPELIDILHCFLKLRKALKSPMTDRALTLSLNKLDNLGKTDREKIAIVSQSIERGWKGLFPLKEPIKVEEELTLGADGVTWYDKDGNAYV